MTHYFSCTYVLIALLIHSKYRKRPGAQGLGNESLYGSRLGLYANKDGLVGYDPAASEKLGHGINSVQGRSRVDGNGTITSTVILVAISLLFLDGQEPVNIIVIYCQND